MTKKALSKEEILHLADLAKLVLSDEEIEKYRKQFSETIDYVKNLDELDTANVEPTNSVVDLKNVTYDDGAQNEIGLTREDATSNASRVKNGEFVVERIMD